MAQGYDRQRDEAARGKSGVATWRQRQPGRGSGGAILRTWGRAKRRLRPARIVREPCPQICADGTRISCFFSDLTFAGFSALAAAGALSLWCRWNGQPGPAAAAAELSVPRARTKPAVNKSFFIARTSSGPFLASGVGGDYCTEGRFFVAGTGRSGREEWRAAGRMGELVVRQ